MFWANYSLFIHNINMEIVLVCVKLFFARAIDVTLGTIKTIYIVKRKKEMAFIISFFEVLIWFYSAKTALSIPIKGFYVPLFYSLGFASGTYIGTYLSSKYIK